MRLSLFSKIHRVEVSRPGRPMLIFISLLTALIIGFTPLVASGQGLNLDWSLTGGGSMPDFGESVITDHEGNVYMTGYFRGTLHLLGQEFVSESASNTMFLVKISPEKEILWLITAEADGVTGAGGFSLDFRNEYIYLMGNYRGNATFFSADFSDMQLSAVYNSVFIAKYTTQGILEWVRSITSGHSTGITLTGSASGLKTDASGSVYFSLMFRESVNLAGVPVSAGIGGNTFYALLGKLDALGGYQWHWNSTNINEARAQGLTVTADENILFSVQYADTLSIPGHSFQNPGGGMALVELSAAGEYLWHHNILTQETNRVNFFDADTDAHGNLYVVGSFRTDLQWNQETVFETPSTLRSSAILIKLNPQRELQWVRILGDPEYNNHIRTVRAVYPDAVFIGGEYRGTVDMGSGFVFASNDDSADVFYAIINHEQETLDAGAVGGPGTEVFACMAVSPGLDVYLAGRFSSVFEAGEESFPSYGSWDFFLSRFAAPSSDSSLSMIEIDGEPLEGFDPGIELYDFPLPHNWENVPQVTATTSDPDAEVRIVQAQSLDGEPEERTALITVTAPDQVSETVYSVLFWRLSDEVRLSMIYLDGSVFHDFDPDVYHYEHSLGETYDLPHVTAQTMHPSASAMVTQATSAQGSEEERTARILVTAQDPQVQTEYSLLFFSTVNALTPCLAPLLLYPNPARDYIQLQGIPDEVVIIRLIDLDARRLGEYVPHGDQLQIPVSHLKPGTYLLQLESENKNLSIYRFQIR